VIGSANGTGTAASFNNLTGLLVDSSDHIYVSDSWNEKIREIQ
jgi:hypothetical protein